jgi:hypothetical protein
LIDRIAIIERGIEGTSVYLIKISYLEHNSDLGLWNDGGDDIGGDFTF